MGTSTTTNRQMYVHMKLAQCCNHVQYAKLFLTDIYTVNKITHVCSVYSWQEIPINTKIVDAIVCARYHICSTERIHKILLRNATEPKCAQVNFTL